ncbi:hypothetical protein HK099_004569, partial [Clydaea vesicula]
MDLEKFLASSIPNPIKFETNSIKQLLADVIKENNSLNQKLNYEVFNSARVNQTLIETKKLLDISNQKLSSLKYDPFSTFPINLTLKQNLSEKKIEVEKKDNEIFYLKSELEKAVSEKSLYEREILLRDKKIFEAEKENKRNKVNLKLSQEDLERTFKSLTFNELKCKNLENEISKVKTNSEKCKFCQAKDENISHMEMQIVDLKSEIQNLDKINQVSENVIDDLSEQLNVVQGTVLDLKSSMNKLESTNKVLTKKLETSNYMKLNEEHQKKFLKQTNTLALFNENSLKSISEVNQILKEHTLELSNYLQKAIEVLTCLKLENNNLFYDKKLLLDQLRQSELGYQSQIISLKEDIGLNCTSFIKILSEGEIFLESVNLNECNETNSLNSETIAKYFTNFINLLKQLKFEKLDTKLNDNFTMMLNSRLVISERLLENFVLNAENENDLSTEVIISKLAKLESTVGSIYQRTCDWISAESDKIEESLIVTNSLVGCTPSLKPCSEAVDVILLNRNISARGSQLNIFYEPQSSFDDRLKFTFGIGKNFSCEEDQISAMETKTSFNFSDIFGTWIDSPEGVKNNNAPAVTSNLPDTMRLATVKISTISEYIKNKQNQIAELKKCVENSTYTTTSNSNEDINEKLLHLKAENFSLRERVKLVENIIKVDDNSNRVKVPSTKCYLDRSTTDETYKLLKLEIKRLNDIIATYEIKSKVKEKSDLENKLFEIESRCVYKTGENRCFEELEKKFNELSTKFDSFILDDHLRASYQSEDFFLKSKLNDLQCNYDLLNVSFDSFILNDHLRASFDYESYRCCKEFNELEKMYTELQIKFDQYVLDCHLRFSYEIEDAKDKLSFFAKGNFVQSNTLPDKGSYSLSIAPLSPGSHSIGPLSAISATSNRFFTPTEFHVDFETYDIVCEEIAQLREEIVEKDNLINSLQKELSIIEVNLKNYASCQNEVLRVNDKLKSQIISLISDFDTLRSQHYTMLIETIEILKKEIHSSFILKNFVEKAMTNLQFIEDSCESNKKQKLLVNALLNNTTFDMHDFFSFIHFLENKIFIVSAVGYIKEEPGGKNVMLYERMVDYEEIDHGLNTDIKNESSFFDIEKRKILMEIQYQEVCDKFWALYRNIAPTVEPTVEIGEDNLIPAIKEILSSLMDSSKYEQLILDFHYVISYYDDIFSLNNDLEHSSFLLSPDNNVPTFSIALNLLEFLKHHAYKNDFGATNEFSDELFNIPDNLRYLYNGIFDFPTFPNINPLLKSPLDYYIKTANRAASELNDVTILFNQHVLDEHLRLSYELAPGEVLEKSYSMYYHDVGVHSCMENLKEKSSTVSQLESTLNLLTESASTSAFVSHEKFDQLLLDYHLLLSYGDNSHPSLQNIVDYDAAKEQATLDFHLWMSYFLEFNETQYVNCNSNLILGTSKQLVQPFEENGEITYCYNVGCQQTMLDLHLYMSYHSLRQEMQALEKMDYNNSQISLDFASVRSKYENLKILHGEVATQLKNVIKDNERLQNEIAYLRFKNVGELRKIEFFKFYKNSFPADLTNAQPTENFLLYDQLYLEHCLLLTHFDEFKNNHDDAMTQLQDTLMEKVRSLENKNFCLHNEIKTLRGFPGIKFSPPLSPKRRIDNQLNHIPQEQNFTLSSSKLVQTEDDINIAYNQLFVDYQLVFSFYLEVDYRNSISSVYNFSEVGSRILEDNNSTSDEIKMILIDFASILDTYFGRNSNLNSFSTAIVKELVKTLISENTSLCVSSDECKMQLCKSGVRFIQSSQDLMTQKEQVIKLEQLLAEEIRLRNIAEGDLRSTSEDYAVLHSRHTTEIFELKAAVDHVNTQKGSTEQEFALFIREADSIKSQLLKENEAFKLLNSLNESNISTAKNKIMKLEEIEKKNVETLKMSKIQKAKLEEDLLLIRNKWEKFEINEENLLKKSEKNLLNSNATEVSVELKNYEWESHPRKCTLTVEDINRNYDLTNKISASDDKIKELEDNLKNLCNLYDKKEHSLVSKISQQEMIISDKLEELSLLEEKMVVHSKELGIEKSKGLELSTTISNQFEAIKNLKLENDVLSEELKKIKKSFYDSVKLADLASLEDVRKELLESNDETEQLSENLRGLEKSLVDTDIKLAWEKNISCTSDKQLNSALEKITILENKVLEKKNTITLLKNELNNANAFLKLENHRQSEMHQVKDNQLNEIKREISLLFDLNTANEQKVTELKRKCDAVNEEKSKAEALLATIQQQPDDNNLKILQYCERCNRELGNALCKPEAFENRINDYINDLHSKILDWEDVSKIQFERLQAEISNKTLKSEELLAKQTTEMEKLNVMINDLGKKNNSLESVVNLLQRTISETEEKLLANDIKLSQLIKEKDEAVFLRTTSEIELAELRNNFCAEKSLKEELEKELELKVKECYELNLENAANLLKLNRQLEHQENAATITLKERNIMIEEELSMLKKSIVFEKKEIASLQSEKAEMKTSLDYFKKFSEEQKINYESTIALLNTKILDNEVILKANYQNLHGDGNNPEETWKKLLLEKNDLIENLTKSLKTLSSENDSLTNKYAVLKNSSNSKTEELNKAHLQLLDHEKANDEKRILEGEIKAEKNTTFLLTNELSKLTADFHAKNEIMQKNFLA